MLEEREIERRSCEEDPGKSKSFQELREIQPNLLNLSLIFY